MAIRQTLDGWRFAAILLAVLTAFAGVASAQCFTPDNLDGTCCDDAAADLPAFPDINLATKYICFRDCQLSFEADLPVKVKHDPVGCGLSLIRFDITNSGGGLVIWKGKLIASYSRTWAEQSPTSSTPDTQVWRFLVNGDFKIDPFVVSTYGSNECIVPPSYATYDKILVTGYVDYALDCTTGNWSMSFALGHECDRFEHDNLFSARPGVFGNDGRTYNWVAPAAGFVVDPLVANASGPVLNEGIRDNDFSMPLDLICNTEQPIGQGQFDAFAADCPCKDGPAVNQWSLCRLFAVSNCGTTIASVPNDVWDAFLSKGIGFWTDPLVYPGREFLHLQQGFFDYQDGCGTPLNRYYMKGVHTQAGWLTFRFIGATLAPVSDRFIDLGTAIPLSATPFTPAVGRRYLSDRMIAVNVD